MNLTYHSDNAHGWLFVPNSALHDLGLSADNFSQYSYRDDSGVYAEEDCDAAIVIKAIESAGQRLVFKELSFEGSHWIRNLSRCGTQ
jgi:hypothetical protein